jgi:hypothetical protein
MNAASLPRRAQHTADRRLQAFVRVGDDELGATQAALDQALQERRPEDLRLRRPNVQAHDFPFALSVHRHSDYHRHRPDLPALALLEIGGIQPKIRPVADKRAFEEGIHPVVNVLAELAHRALADPGQPHRLHQVVHPPGGHAANPGLLNDGHQGLLRRLARLQERREVAALPQLGDPQLQAPQPRVQRPVAVAVAVGRTLGRALVPPGADQPLHIRLHQQLHHRLRNTAQEVAISGFRQQLSKR